MDYTAASFTLIEDADTGTLKRLLSGIDVDQCIPCVMVNGEPTPIRKIRVEEGMLVFEAY